jgi:type IX secretion system PorP/SprF family membrane protein
MNTKEIVIVILSCLGLSVSSVSGQDLAFSQFYANPVYLNPALAGNKFCPRITLNYRNQYPSLDDHYVSYSFSSDTYVNSISGGIAALVTADMSGPLATYSGSAVYSYSFSLGRDLLMNAAMQVGYLQYRLNWENLIFEDMIVPGTGEIIEGTESQPDKLSIGNVDFATGVLAGYKQRFYLGVAVHHLTTPDLAFYTGSTSRVNMRITVHSGALFYLEPDYEGNDLRRLSVSPNLVYMQQGEFHQLNAGVSVNVYPFVAGVWLRHNFSNPDAMIASLGFQQAQYKIGYSYDFTLSRMGLPAGGAHEVSVAWLLPSPKKEFVYKAIKNPSF